MKTKLMMLAGTARRAVRNLVLFAAVAVALGARAATEKVGGYTWTYRINGGIVSPCLAEIFGPKNSSSGKNVPAILPRPKGAIVIPSKLGGCPVARIGDYSFQSCSEMTSLTIPDNVTDISVAGAFIGCWGLESFVVVSNNPSYTSSSGLLLTKDGKGLVAVPKGLTALTVPDGVTSIEFAAAMGCVKLKAVTIPQGVTSIGDLAFCSCGHLTNVTIPPSVESIGRKVFSNCSESLFDMETIPGVKLVDYWAVEHTDSLSGNLDLTGIRGIGGGAFKGCRRLTGVKIPDGVTSIEPETFQGCNKLRHVTIPKSITSIGLNAFSGCDESMFDTKTIPGVKLLDDWAVGHDDSLSQGHHKGVHINLEGVRGIGQGVFLGCTSLTNMVISTSVKRIESLAFAGCSSLRSVVIPQSIETIEVGAFVGCEMIASLKIADSVKSIEKKAFYKCLSLEDLQIPDSVTNIGAEAFGSCVSITNLTLGRGVTSIGSEAFGCCMSLTNLTFGTSVTSIGSKAFVNCQKLTEVRIPPSVTSIGAQAFAECSALKVAYLPKSLMGKLNGNEFPKETELKYYDGGGGFVAFLLLVVAIGAALVVLKRQGRLDGVMRSKAYVQAKDICGKVCVRTQSYCSRVGSAISRRWPRKS